MFSDFFKRLSPIQPEIGSIGVFFSMKSFFQPTFTNMLFISAEIHRNDPSCSLLCHSPSCSHQ